MTEWFYCTRIIYRCGRSKWNLLLSLRPTGVDKISDPRIYFIMLLIVTFIVRFVYIINFSKHLCSYRAILLNDWYTPIVTLLYFSFYDCNTLLRMTHYCSNYSIERIVSITLVNALDWTQCAAWTVFLSVWEQIYSFPWGGSLWCVILVVLFFWNCSVSDPNFLFAWCIGHCDCIFWVLQNTVSYHQQ